MCRQMSAATEEQRASGRYIATNLESITEMIGSIQADTSAHERASASVAETITAILANARESSARLPQLATAVAELQEPDARPGKPEPPRRSSARPGDPPQEAASD
jgi:methyl-accepting chemotaxis protein